MILMPNLINTIPSLKENKLKQFKKNGPSCLSYCYFSEVITFRIIFKKKTEILMKLEK